MDRTGVTCTKEPAVIKLAQLQEPAALLLEHFLYA